MLELIDLQCANRNSICLHSSRDINYCFQGLQKNRSLVGIINAELMFQEIKNDGWVRSNYTMTIMFLITFLREGINRAHVAVNAIET